MNSRLIVELSSDLDYEEMVAYISLHLLMEELLPQILEKCSDSKNYSSVLNRKMML